MSDVIVVYIIIGVNVIANLMTLPIMYITIGVNVVANLNSVYVINKPCVYTSTMRLSTFCGLHRDTEQCPWKMLGSSQKFLT